MEKNNTAPGAAGATPVFIDAKVEFKFKDRALLGPHIHMFLTKDKENSILRFFKEEPSQKMLNFLAKMGTIINCENVNHETIYKVNANIDDIKEIIAFSDWGLDEVYTKAKMADQTKGIFCFFRNELVAAYLKATGKNPLETGIATSEEGYRLMTKQDFIDGINALWKEMRKLKERLEEIPDEMTRIAETYATSFLPQTGYVVGQKVTVTNRFTGKEEEAFFAGVKASTIHPDGNLTLHFHFVKKDGTPAKRINQRLTQYLEVD